MKTTNYLKKKLAKNIAFISAVTMTVMQLSSIPVYADNASSIADIRYDNEALSANNMNDIVEKIEINSKEDFYSFVDSCRKNSWSKGVYVSLNTDINLNGEEFSGIPSFSGEFNGNGHTISEISVTSGDEAVGLFRYLEKDGKIYDLNVSGTIISTDSRDIIGGIVGVNSGTLLNCKFDGKITGLNVAAGLVGLNGSSGRIIACENKGYISSHTNVAGIAGINRGYIEDSVNNGNVNSDSSWVDDTTKDTNSSASKIESLLENGKNIGGIAGWSNGIIASCINNGVVGYYRTGENVGGVVGCHSGIIFYSKNTGKVFGKTDVGGVVGQFIPTISIEDITTIKAEFDKLHDILNDSANDLDEATDSITGNIGSIGNNAEKAVDYLDKAIDEGTDLIKNDKRSVNELSDRVVAVIKMLDPIDDYINSSIDQIDLINESLDKIEASVPMSSSDKEKLEKSRKNINNKTKDLKNNGSFAITQIDEAIKILSTANSTAINATEQYIKSLEDKGQEKIQAFSEAATARQVYSQTLNDYLNAGNANHAGKTNKQVLEDDLKGAGENITVAISNINDIQRDLLIISDIIDEDIEKADEKAKAEWEKASTAINGANASLQNALDIISSINVDAIGDDINKAINGFSVSVGEITPETISSGNIITINSGISADDINERMDYYSRNIKEVIYNLQNATSQLAVLGEVMDEIVNNPVISDEDKEQLKKLKANINANSESLRNNTTQANLRINEAMGIISEANEISKEARDNYINKLENLENSISSVSLQISIKDEYEKAYNQYMASPNKVNPAKTNKDVVNEDFALAKEYLSNAEKDANDINGYVLDVYDLLTSYLNGTYNQIDEEWKKCSAASTSLLSQVKGANNTLGGIGDYLNSKSKIEMINFTSNFDTNMDNLKSEVDSTLNRMEKLNNDVSKHTDNLENDMRAINDQMQVLTDLLIDRVNSLEKLTTGEDIIVDNSENDKNGDNCTNIISCFNEGSIDGNTNVGGIIGNIGVDTEDNQAKSLGTKYELAAVVLNSVNTGFVNVKNKNAGGIVGNADAGYIANCQSSGGIFSTEGNYIGGIAGCSKGTIVSCNSLAVLTGNEYIGGIAGVADDVNGCLSMAKILDNNGRIGAIMGAYQSNDDDITIYHQSMNDHIFNNYYVSDDLLGIDSVSYTGVAEGIEYSEIVKMAAVFNHLRIYFIDEDYNLVSDREYRYGSDLSDIFYPELVTSDGTYAQWQKPSGEYMTSNLVLRSEVVDNVTVLASNVLRNEKPVAFASGIFTKEAKLELKTSELTPPVAIPEGSEVDTYELYLVNANVSENQITPVRVLKNAKGNASIYAYNQESKNWKSIEYKEIGSYYEIAMTDDNITICLVTTPENKIMLYIIAVTGLAVLLVIIIIIIANKRKKKKINSKEDAKEE